MSRILQVNKFYYPKGGSESVMFDTITLLESAGHEIIPFAMQHRENVSSPYSRYFIPNVEYNEDQRLSLFGQMKAAVDIVYSLEAGRKIDALIRDTSPDLAHLHNIYHQLSPSILSPLKRRGIPTVMTLHDCKLMCPAGTFLSPKGLCESCGKGHFYHAVHNRCVKNSKMKSAVCMTEMYLHRRLRLYERGIDLFVTPSKFLRDKLVEHGRLDEERIVHLPNAVDPGEYEPAYDNQGYALYFGRIEAYKGIVALVEAMARIPDIRLIVAGRGTGEDEVRSLVQKRGLRNVELAGYKTGLALKELIQGAAVVVVPPICYENCPMTVLEAFASGKPVIGSRLGGVPELIDDGTDGLLFQPGDPDELSSAISSITSNRRLAARMGEKAREKVVSHYSAERYLSSLLETYSGLLRRAGRT